MILKKKEVIAAALVVMIGLAGYLNWSYQDTVKVRDNEDYIETGKLLGEAEMVSSTNEETKKEETPPENTAYFEDAKANRESARASAMETLKATSEDSQADEKTRALAGEKLVGCAKDIELENTIEAVAESKGYKELVVYLNEGSAIVTVRSEGLGENDIKVISEIIMETAGTPMDKIKIIEVK